MDEDDQHSPSSADDREKDGKSSNDQDSKFPVASAAEEEDPDDLLAERREEEEAAFDRDATSFRESLVPPLRLGRFGSENSEQGTFGSDALRSSSPPAGLNIISDLDNPNNYFEGFSAGVLTTWQVQAALSDENNEVSPSLLENVASESHRSSNESRGMLSFSSDSTLPEVESSSEDSSSDDSESSGDWDEDEDDEEEENENEDEEDEEEEEEEDEEDFAVPVGDGVARAVGVVEPMGEGGDGEANSIANADVVGSNGMAVARAVAIAGYGINASNNNGSRQRRRRRRRHHRRRFTEDDLASMETENLILRMELSRALSEHTKLRCFYYNEML